MPLLLSIETATEICSVCLHEGENILSLNEIHQKNSHVASITLLIKKAFDNCNLSLSNLDAVAISAGPGSYTGLRVGASTAKGLAFGLDIPMIAIHTLDYLAHSVQNQSKPGSLIVPTICARRMEVYTAFFDYKLNTIKAVHNLILEKDSFLPLLRNYDEIIILGNGAEKSKSLYLSDTYKYIDRVCSAKLMVYLVNRAFCSNDYVDTAYFSPFYYKSPNITKSTKAL